jgi:hypothetical protein
MKITKRQLRRIIGEAVGTDTLKLADLVRAVDYEGDGRGGGFKPVVGKQVGTVVEIDEDPDYPTQYTVLFPDGTTIMDDLGPPGEQRFQLVNENKMKITKRQLRRIIREVIDEQPETDPDFMDSAEYDRGYQDGLDQVPVANDATVDYDAGYEDGYQDATLPEPHHLNENNRPWGTYAEKRDDYFSDTIVMSPNGDSMLVDGLETYTQDVPSQLGHVSGFPVPDMIGDVMTTELERQEQSGYVEMGVEYKNGEWTGSW